MEKGDNRICKLKQLAVPHLLFLISHGNSSEKSQVPHPWELGILVKLNQNHETHYQEWPESWSEESSSRSKLNLFLKNIETSTLDIYLIHILLNTYDILRTSWTPEFKGEKAQF